MGGDPSGAIHIPHAVVEVAQVVAEISFTRTTGQAAHGGNLDHLENHLSNLVSSFADRESSEINGCVESATKEAATNSYMWKGGKRARQALTLLAGVTCFVGWVTG
jgi:hypothetical protein